MKYGKRLRDEVNEVFPEWKGQFISYKTLKKELNKVMINSKLLDIQSNIGFTRLLDSELDKVITFYFDKEEDYIIRLKELKELRIRAENLRSDEEKLQVQTDLLNFHAEMVLLLRYNVLNFTGLIKIVKKHNKRTGKPFKFSSMSMVKQQPFSTDSLFKLMEECEALLNDLFVSNPDT